MGAKEKAKGKKGKRGDDDDDDDEDEAPKAKAKAKAKGKKEKVEDDDADKDDDGDNDRGMAEEGGLNDAPTKSASSGAGGGKHSQYKVAKVLSSDPMKKKKGHFLVELQTGDKAKMSPAA